MNKSDFQSSLTNAAASGTLMTPKHDPGNLGTLTFEKVRTVLSYELAANLTDFIVNGLYDVIEYEDKNPHHSPSYFEIIPHCQTFSVPASGVAAMSLSATSTCDRLVALSGSKQGWHMFGEQAQKISSKVTCGELVPRSRLR